MSSSDSALLANLVSQQEWIFAAHNGENPFEYSSLGREEFADSVLAIMGNNKLHTEAKGEEIEKLLSQVRHEAAIFLMQRKMNRGYDPETEEREWAEDQKWRGRDGL